MIKRRILSILFVAAMAAAGFSLFSNEANAAGQGQPTDWNRFYYYPYVYYPHSFQRPRSFNHMYYRYGPSQRIPVYNENWYNFYPTDKPYHSGHHFVLDVF